MTVKIDHLILGVKTAFVIIRSQSKDLLNAAPRHALTQVITEPQLVTDAVQQDLLVILPLRVSKTLQ